MAKSLTPAGCRLMIMDNFSNTDKNIKGYFSLNKWQPTTGACAFVQASLDDTLRSFVDWTTPLAAKYDATLRMHEIKGTIDDAFAALLPPKHSTCRRVRQ